MEGNGSFADAGFGDNNSATATNFGDGEGFADARAFLGDNNTATATNFGEGDGSAIAIAADGNGNTATATKIGDSDAQTIAEAGGFTITGTADDNFATATGVASDATARDPEGCTIETGDFEADVCR